MNLYLIESVEHSRDGVKSWWKPSENGYTRSYTEAGRYTKEHAEQILARQNRFSVTVKMWTEDDVLNERAGKHELIVLVPEENNTEKEA